MMLWFLVLFPIASGLLAFIVTRRYPRLETLLAILAGAIEFLVTILAVALPGEHASTLPGLLSASLSLTMDGFRRLYCIVIAFMWLATLIFARQYMAHDGKKRRYFLFNLLTLGGTMGVFLSADLFTTFVFFEMISLTSYVWVAHEETVGALRAAETYLAIAVIGGLTALMGLSLLSTRLGTLKLDELYSAAKACSDRKTLYIAGACLLFGFGAKAGLYPLHIWLPKAHPVAPAPASALLSGILTKCGVFGVAAMAASVFRADPAWGTVLMVLGVITMLLGAVLAVFSIDLKRTLACSSMSQIGFVTVGIALCCLLGEENALAARGTVLHMMNHSVFKLVLFMAAGTVYMNLHALNLNDIRGFGRKKPLLLLVFLSGALGIGGIPLFSGYVSKTLLHEGIVELAGATGNGWVTVVEWLFLTAGGMTLAYMTKLFTVLFIEKHPERQEEFESMHAYARFPTAAVLSVSAVIIPILGLLPNRLMMKLADSASPFFAGEPLAHSVAFFSLENLKGAAISLIIGAAVYFGFIRKCLIKQGRYVDPIIDRFDLEDKVYRPVLLRFLPFVFGSFAALFGENKLLTPICKGVKSAAGWIAAGFGDNKLLKPAVNAVFMGGGSELRAMNGSHESIPEEIPVDDIRNRFTYKLGALTDKTLNRRKKHRHVMATTFVRVERALNDGFTRVVRNLSFSMLMTCLGLVILLLYVLFRVR